MNKHISKEAVLKAAAEKQEALIKSFEDRVVEMKEDAYGKEHSASQSEDRSAGKLDMLASMQNELGLVKMDMSYLNSLKADHEISKVEPGAVVVTNQRIFFIAISAEKFEVDGKEIFGISTKAPIYSAMADCKKGDHFTFNGIKYIIEDVY